MVGNSKNHKSNARIACHIIYHPARQDRQGEGVKDQTRKTNSEIYIFSYMLGKYLRAENRI
jgi:hypothetical protein